MVEVEHREPVLLNDALARSAPHPDPGHADEEEAIIIVPLIIGDEVIGAMNISRTGGDEVAFTDADFELVQLFAGQAAVAITNARLYEELRTRVDAQRSLAEIAAQIASLHEPQTVLDRAVADAGPSSRRRPRPDQPYRASPGRTSSRRSPRRRRHRPPDDVIVPLGSGIAGMAARRAPRVLDGRLPRRPGVPARRGRRADRGAAIHSMMSAPLIGPDRLIGTITVQSASRTRSASRMRELLKLLADQAAIALTNARLSAEVEESERRYRHLVDNSPDIVWSVDAEGRFTFFSDSLEARTGWKPAQLIGQPFTVLAGEATLAGATAAWEHAARGTRPRAARAPRSAAARRADGEDRGGHDRHRCRRPLRRRARRRCATSASVSAWRATCASQAAELAAGQERAHLARELHDSVTQALFSMGLTLRTLELLLGTDPRPPARSSRAERAPEGRAGRDADPHLRAAPLVASESDGLVQALRTHATAVARRTGLAIVVDAEPIDRLPLSTEEALYRIGQEALHNVVKHANASAP